MRQAMLKPQRAMLGRHLGGNLGIILGFRKHLIFESRGLVNVCLLRICSCTNPPNAGNEVAEQHLLVRDGERDVVHLRGSVRSCGALSTGNSMANSTFSLGRCDARLTRFSILRRLWAM